MTMDNKILNGQTAIVTGSGRGIGRAIAIAFSEAGANAVVCARNKNEIEFTADLIKNNGGCSLAIQTDVTNIQDAELLVKELTGKLCVSLASGVADKLSGRYIHVMDDQNKIIDNAEEVVEKKLYEMTINKL
jgi:NAD(P)-dependent dehydrogenase (short-subunit alcohol dehydrogenase family)